MEQSSAEYRNSNAPARTPIFQPPHNVPTLLTRFIGREAECEQISARLRDSACRLVTITGPGGVGKTRLGLEVAQRCLADESCVTRFADGIWFVPLASMNHDDLLDDTLATTIADTLGIAFAGPDAPAIQVSRTLREKTLLLLLDNCEYIPGVASFISRMLRDAPGLTILATSREPLHVGGEWRVAIDGLVVPPDEAVSDVTTLGAASAVQLFVQCTQMHLPDFALTHVTAPAVVEICRLVAGLPLGIELAVNWTSVLSCSEIATEIAHNLDFLTHAQPDVPQRQHSLRAVFTSSWEQLFEDNQRVLRRLAVFGSSFTREAANDVAGATLAHLAALLSASLLRRIPTPNDRVRYALLDPLRLYAAEQLDRAGETEDVVAAHAAWYLHLLASLTADLRGARQREALDRIASDIVEIRAAWQWACNHAATDAIIAATDSLFHFYDMRSWFVEGVSLFGAANRALATHQMNASDALVWGKTLAREGWFTFYLGRQHDAKALLEQSLEVLQRVDNAVERIFPLNYLAAVNTYLGAYDQTDALAHESLALARTAGDLYGQAVAYNILGQAAYERENYGAAQQWSQQSLVIEQQIGNRWSEAFSLTNLGKAAYARGAYHDAQHLISQSLAIREAMGDTRGVALCLMQLGDTAVALHMIQEAGTRYAQSWGLFRDIGNLWGMAAALINLSGLRMNQSHDGSTERLLAEALRLALQTGALPQMRAILAASIPLLQLAGERAWAAELAQYAADQHVSLDRYRTLAERLLTWLTATSALLPDTRLEWAIAAAQEPSPPAMSSSTSGQSVQQQTNPTPRAQSRVDTLIVLTTRERDVLHLVAQGLTDKEIAVRLVLSPRTVGTHLTAIYSKLQVSTRSAATRFAIDHGIVV